MSDSILERNNTFYAARSDYILDLLNAIVVAALDAANSASTLDLLIAFSA